MTSSIWPLLTVPIDRIRTLIECAQRAALRDADADAQEYDPSPFHEKISFIHAVAVIVSDDSGAITAVTHYLEQNLIGGECTAAQMAEHCVRLAGTS